MILRILRRSLRNRWKPVLLVFLSALSGTALASGLLGVAFDISGKVQKELKAYGANIAVSPSQGFKYLNEKDLYKIKTVFWRHNIDDFVPYLFVPAGISAGISESARIVLAGTWFGRTLPLPSGEGNYSIGLATMAPWWKVEGKYPAREDEVIVGITVARKLGIEVGGKVTLSIDGKDFSARVSGIADTGGFEDGLVFGELAAVQGLSANEGRISTVMVSAVTVPADDFARRNPETMTKEEYERWYCTPYVTSVALNIEEVMENSSAVAVWQVADAEGRVLGKLKLLIWTLTFLVLLSAAFAVSTAMGMTIVERRTEIGLMKAIGADRLQVAAIFLGEVSFIGLAAGVCGGFVGQLAAHIIGVTVFDSPFTSEWTTFLIAISSALLVSVAGSLPPLRQVLKIDIYSALRKPV